MKLIWMSLALVLVAGCGGEPGRATLSATRSATSSASVQASGADTQAVAEGYVDQVNALCGDLLAEVMTFDIGNAVTIEQFLGKHEPLVAAVRAFDARVASVPVTEADRPAADAFDAYRRFSDAADAQVVTAARTGDEHEFEAANVAFLEQIHSDPPEIEAMHAAGIQCNAR